MRQGRPGQEGLLSIYSESHANLGLAQRLQDSRTPVPTPLVSPHFSCPKVSAPTRQRPQTVARLTETS